MVRDAPTNPSSPDLIRAGTYLVPARREAKTWDGRDKPGHDDNDESYVRA